MKCLLLASFLPLLVCAQRLTEKENEKLQYHCGKYVKNTSRRRSMHTRQVARLEAPWVARVEYTKNYFPKITIAERNKNSSDTVAVCSASLISPRHVLTAAHCIESVKKTCVVFTESCKTGCNAKDGFYDVRYTVKKIYSSRNYTGSYCVGSTVLPRNDVAIIELTKDVKYSDQLYPVCLAGNEGLKQGDKLTHCGYGMGHNVTNGTLLYDNDLDEMRKYVGTVVEKCTIDSTSDVICHSHASAALCYGDNGGGQVVYKEGQATVVAVASKIGIGYSSLVKDQNTWVCAATGICTTDQALRHYNEYKELGLPQFWYKTHTPYTGLEVYV